MREEIFKKLFRKRGDSISERIVWLRKIGVDRHTIRNMRLDRDMDELTFQVIFNDMVRMRSIMPSSEA
jgi:uncharacterized protein (DUF934 family)